MPVLETD